MEEVAFWTSDTGINGETPVELDDLDLILIDPLPSHVWYQDMVDFADGISDRDAGERLSRSLEGKSAFRRFKNELYQRHPELICTWHGLRDARARFRAVQWLVDEGLIDEDAAQRFKREHPSPPCGEVRQRNTRPGARKARPSHRRVRLSSAGPPCVPDARVQCCPVRRTATGTVRSTAQDGRDSRGSRPARACASRTMSTAFTAAMIAMPAALILAQCTG